MNNAIHATSAWVKGLLEHIDETSQVSLYGKLLMDSYRLYL